MTDPQNPIEPTRPPVSPVPPAPANAQPPAYGQPPVYGQPPAAQPQYGQQPYAAAPPPAYGPPVTQTIPGRTLGIVAFILSFFVALVALVLAIIAMVQSKRAGYKNPWALGAIIISSVLLVVGIIVSIALIAAFSAGLAEVARLCAEYGTGVHEINGVTVELACP